MLSLEVNCFRSFPFLLGPPEVVRAKDGVVAVCQEADQRAILIFGDYVCLPSPREVLTQSVRCSGHCQTETSRLWARSAAFNYKLRSATEGIRVHQRWKNKIGDRSVRARTRTLRNNSTGRAQAWFELGGLARKLHLRVVDAARFCASLLTPTGR